MNKIAQLSAVVLVALTMTGCSIQPLLMGNASSDANYLTAVREAAPSLETIDAQVLIGSGKGVCSQLVAHRTGDDLLYNAIKAGLTEQEGAAIIKSAIDAFCPTQMWPLRV